MSATGELRHRKPEETADQPAEKANENETPSSEATGQDERRPSGGILSFDFVFLLVSTIIVIFAVKYLEVLSLSKPPLFTKEQLATYDGSDGSPLYVAILGEIYDVSKGEKYYGKEKGYHCFVAKDGTRAYITGEFVADLTDDVTDFDAEKHGGLVEWRSFYRDHEEYTFVGRVTGAFYDAMGEPTEALKAVEEGAAQAERIKTEREAAKKLNPNCNSKWAQGKGGEVWCKEGYPRLITERFEGASEKTRCACFMETDHSEDKRLYDNCKPDDTRCVVPPKDEAKEKDVKKQ